ncbi:hypothetical protein MJS38_17875, partial [Burkholderia gladioli]|uniref:hypothetical protein n=1 Tax=Burkholderia TaxID=32008 RepID=UPI000BF23113|nr:MULTISPECIES: hypothetical protein [Burkholderia]TWC75386.1 hypothetical protein FB600_10446 [Burkholderia sp. SJZ089]TWD05302.1 hypothetical protein FB601_10846 [Burkholderia sp. SJZ091]MBJ9660265.1 hypothetical protein [Burkholderia gladioli]MBJ9715983.1 hypothetical protein [Burkholderia gladioli]MBU9156428.1 hypothetical protein [Burkholderia gladioli]
MANSRFRISFPLLFTLLLGGGTTAAMAEPASPTAHRVYTNADFYVDGVFQKEVAKDAIAQLAESYGQRITPEMRAQLWISDFGLHDFEHVGLTEMIWVNQQQYGYYAMTMYLLPNQMLPEHRHMPIASPPARPAKHESWRVLHGWVYDFSEIGPKSAEIPAIPKSFGPVRSQNVVVQHEGEVRQLKQLESWHFMMASPQGAIVDEYGNWQDHRGWFSSNPKVAP